MFAKSICLAVVVAGALAISAQANNDLSRELTKETAKHVAPQEPQGAGLLNVLQRGSNALEGTWVVTVNLAAPPPGFGPSFTALETYSHGGGMVTSNNLPPVPRPGQGAWEKRGNQFAVVIQFFLFDQNGAPAGSVRVTHNITLKGNDEYTGAGEAKFFALNGSLLTTVAFTTEGRRLTP